LAQFVTFGAGLVKPEMLIDGQAPPGLPVVIGVDLAISEKEGADWTAIVALSRDPVSGLVYILEAERHRCGFHAVLERIQAAAARHHPQLIAVEQVQYQAAVVQELTRTTRLPVRGVRPDRDKLTRFMPLLTRFEQGQVRLDPSGVPAWLREELLSFPEGRNDDGCDGLSLAFSAAASQGAPLIATWRPAPRRRYYLGIPLIMANSPALSPPAPDPWTIRASPAGCPIPTPSSRPSVRISPPTATCAPMPMWVAVSGGARAAVKNLEWALERAAPLRRGFTSPSWPSWRCCPPPTPPSPAPVPACRP
jgi:predicted phage terminase large subunit-like protein